MSNIKQRLELFKVLRLTPQFWRSAGEKIKGWIRKDMMNGILQDYTNTGAYRYSRQYAKYKQNNMRRFTGKTGKQLKRKGTDKLKNQVDASFGLFSGKTNGTRLVGYEGKSIRSNRVDKVNMYLTGALIDGLHVVRATIKGVIMSYASKDRKKIEGNARLGRIITTLREENRKKLIKEIEREVKTNIGKSVKSKIIINV